MDHRDAAFHVWWESLDSPDENLKELMRRAFRAGYAAGEFDAQD